MQANNIKAVISDLVGVFCRNGTRAFYHSLQDKYNLSKESADIFLAVRQEATTSRLSLEQILDKCNSQWGAEFNPSLMAAEWVALYEPIPEMYELYSSLRQQGTRFGLLTNNVHGVVSHVESLLIRRFTGQGFRDIFEIITPSYEAGIRKPDVNFFRKPLEQMGLPPNEVVYIDDQWQYVESARKFIQM